MNDRLDNSKGKIFYGMHFYPGVARYVEADQDLTIFINENTIRQMDPSFAGRPIYVEHEDQVAEDLDTLRTEADGWVIESFFNQADGKHWAKFILVTDEAIQAVDAGFRLSNAYIPKSFGASGMWNGVPYQQEVLDAEYEHLALVTNPRYEESVIMTPDEFKRYNEQKTVELKKLSNSKKETKMPKFEFFKRQKVENQGDLEGMSVKLPLSKKDVVVANALEAYDKILNLNGYADGNHMVKVGDNEMSVNDLVKAHMEACNSLADMKAKHEEEGKEIDKAANDDQDLEDPAMENDGELDDMGKSDREDLDPAEVKANEEDDKEEDDKKKNKKKNQMDLKTAQEIVARHKAAKLKNAADRAELDNAPKKTLYTSQDMVDRGRARYGSSN